MRVLLVEDEQDARELLTLTLKLSGADVRGVESVQEAMAGLPAFKPHIVVSDIGLPVESGYDLIKRIRGLPSDSGKLPAVALTAFATEKDRKRALSAGFQLHLSKPADPQLLVQTIRKLENGVDARE